MTKPTTYRKRAYSVVAGLAVAVVAGCTAPPAEGINDPRESQNREVHKFNVAVDKQVLRPVSHAYGDTVPRPVRTGVSNFAENLDMPRMIINNILQLRLANAVENSSRFLLNTTVGVGGIFDPADSIGLFAKDTDFGETLHVWGLPEGSYVELPLLGPSTSRDTVGKVVDVVLNPTRALPQEIRQADNIAGTADVANDRYTFTNVIDPVLYESADSYAQARLLYLENRRYKLARGAGEPEYQDLYEELYEDQ